MKTGKIEKKFINTDYSLLWSGQLLSTIGSWIYSMFILIFAASLTNKAIIISGMLMTSMLPNILFGPFIGNLVDKLNKKYVIVCSDFMRGILHLSIIPIMNEFKNDNLTMLILIFIISIISNIAGSFFDPAARSLLPRIVSDNNIKKANSYFSLIGSVSLVLGPAFGGTMVGILGYKGVVFFNACTFIVSALSELFIKYTEEKSKEQEENIGIFEKYKSGWAALSSKIEIKYYVIIAGIRSLVVGLVNISFIFVADKVFLRGAESVGYIYMSLGCGLIGGSLLIAYWKYKVKDIKLYFYVILINAIMSIIYIFTRRPIIVLISMLIVGISDGFQSVILYSNIQNKIENKDIGKVVGCTNSFMMSFQLLSMSIGGVLFDYFNKSYVVFGVSVIVVFWTSISYNKLKRTVRTVAYVN